MKGIINQEVPNLRYSAALIGYGSDVLGYDDLTSIDHNWGPRMQLFLKEEEYQQQAGYLNQILSTRLPFTYQGFPTNYTEKRADRTQSMVKKNTYPILHLIEITTLDRFFKKAIPISNLHTVSIEEWLDFTDQKLIELTRGEVFEDGLNQLVALRKKLQFYPRDVWFLRLASLWEAISQQEAFVGRCRERQDFINLNLLVSRIVTLLVKICFYIERQYIPYSKWLGRGFQDLKCYSDLQELVMNVISEKNMNKIEDKLSQLYELVVAYNNKTPELPKLRNVIQNYYNRPYKVILAQTIVEKLIDQIKIDNIKRIPLNTFALDIKVDVTDLTTCVK